MSISVAIIVIGASNYRWEHTTDFYSFCECDPTIIDVVSAIVTTAAVSDASNRVRKLSSTEWAITITTITITTIVFLHYWIFSVQVVW